MACKYCSPENDKIEFLIDKEEVTIFVNEDYLQINFHGENYKIITQNINNCPMCGQKL